MNTPRVPDTEAGMTLAEVLIAVVVLSIGVLGILSTLSTASLASSHHRTDVNADTVVRSYAEMLKRQVRIGGYVPNAGTGSYAIPAATWAPLDLDGNPGTAEYTVHITSVQCWSTASAAFGSCGAVDDGAQLLTLEARSTAPIRVATEQPEIERLEVIVRKP